MWPVLPVDHLLFGDKNTKKMHLGVKKINFPK
jgi:hypothetical protein